MKTYKGQTDFKLELETGVTHNLNTASVKEILYEKPNGQTGKWDATVVDNNVLVVDDFDTTDLDVRGTWKIQAHYIINGKEGFGDPFGFIVALPIVP